MTRRTTTCRRSSCVAACTWTLSVSVWALLATGCATRTSTMAASTHAAASTYRSATAYVELSPEDAFETATRTLLDRDDLEVTALDEVGRRCTASMGAHTVTTRVIESTPVRSRLTVTVGGGDDTVSNESLATALLRDVCKRLPVPCE